MIQCVQKVQHCFQEILAESMMTSQPVCAGLVCPQHTCCPSSSMANLAGGVKGRSSNHCQTRADTHHARKQACSYAGKLSHNCS